MRVCVLLLCFLLLAGCFPGALVNYLYLEPRPNIETDSQQFVRVYEGQRKQLQASVVMSDGEVDVQNLNWRSENPAVATVDQQGVLKGMARGKTTLVLQALKNPDKQIKIQVEVESQAPITVDVPGDISLGEKTRQLEQLPPITTAPTPRPSASPAQVTR